MDTVETPTAEERDDTMTVRFAISAVFLLSLAVIAVVLFVFGGDDPEPQRAPAPHIVSTSCDLPDSDQTSVSGVPAVGWDIVTGGGTQIEAPSMPEHGPALTDDGVRSCFARSPEGAVLAAANIAAYGSTGQQHTVAEHYAIDGPARDTMLAEYPRDGAASDEGMQLRAFRVIDYTDVDATIEIVVEQSDGTLVAGPIDLTYTGGDWKYDPPTSLESRHTVLDDLSGYITLRKDS